MKLLLELDGIEHADVLMLALSMLITDMLRAQTRLHHDQPELAHAIAIHQRLRAAIKRGDFLP